MEDDERIVTFCPSCAELQKDVVLRLCPKCGFDFRTKAGNAPLWSTVVEEVAEPAPAEPAPAEAAPEAAPAQAAEALPLAAPADAPLPALPPVVTPVAGLPLPVSAPTAPTGAPAIAAWPIPTDVPMGSPMPGRRGGKVCQMCRREYPSLWRLVIQTPYGFEERFVCGTSVTCQMPSVLPAVPV
jgi:hypothetical protein